MDLSRLEIGDVISVIKPDVGCERKDTFRIEVISNHPKLGLSFKGERVSCSDKDEIELVRTWDGRETPDISRKE